MESSHAAEREFTEELGQQTAHYQQTLEVAERIQESIRAEQDITHELMELGQLMSAVSAFQARASQAEQQWKALGLNAGAALREAFETHQSTLKHLVESVRISEDMATAAKSDLEPKLNAVARDRKVVQRYGDASRL